MASVSSNTDIEFKNTPNRCTSACVAQVNYDQPHRQDDLMLQLILGGARSGKSALAERIAIALASANQQRLIYIASSDASQNDCEMARRIQRHQADRGKLWTTIEEPIALAATLQKHSRSDTCILLDCTTLWLTNCLFSADNCWAKEKSKLLDVLPTLAGNIIFVGNEVGQGIVPMGEINRTFVDESGWLHQDLAKLCDRVIFTVAGLPTVLKGEPLNE